MEKRTCNIRYFNLPFRKVHNEKRCIFTEITFMFPDIDIFALCEMYYQSNMNHIEIPAGYILYVHKIGTTKTSAFLYKDTLEVRQIDLNIPITCILVKLGNKQNEWLKLSSFYRSPSKNNDRIIEDYNCIDYKDYNSIFVRYILETGKEKNHLMFADINWNIMEDGRPKNRYGEARAYEEIKSANVCNHWGLSNTYPTKRGGSKLDICITSMETMFGRGICSIPFGKFTIDTVPHKYDSREVSDHYSAIVKIPYCTSDCLGFNP